MVTSKTSRPVISVMLAVPDAPTAIEWYKRALRCCDKGRLNLGVMPTHRERYNRSDYILSPVSVIDVTQLRRAVVVTGFFLLAVVVQGAARPGYDAWHQSISALSLGPGGWVQQVMFGLLGLTFLFTAPVWRRILAGAVGHHSVPLLTTLTGLSLIAAAWWRQDPRPGYDPERLGLALPTATGLMHLAAAAVGAGSAVAAMFVMANRFARLPGWYHWAQSTREAAALTIACVVTFVLWSIEPHGLAGTFERLVFVIPGAWAYAVVQRLGQGVPFVVRPRAT
jgi:hypothetical protein